MAHLLKSSKSLKTLDVSYCSRLNDNLFFGLAINCPLVELNLNFIPNVNIINRWVLNKLLKKYFIQIDNRYYTRFIHSIGKHFTSFKTERM